MQAYRNWLLLISFVIATALAGSLLVNATYIAQFTFVFGAVLVTGWVINLVLLAIQGLPITIPGIRHGPGATIQSGAPPSIRLTFTNLTLPLGLALATMYRQWLATPPTPFWHFDLTDWLQAALFGIAIAVVAAPLLHWAKQRLMRLPAAKT